MGSTPRACSSCDSSSDRGARCRRTGDRALVLAEQAIPRARARRNLRAPVVRSEPWRRSGTNEGRRRPPEPGCGTTANALAAFPKGARRRRRPLKRRAATAETQPRTRRKRKYAIVAKDTLRRTLSDGDDDGGWRVDDSPPRVGRPAEERAPRAKLVT